MKVTLVIALRNEEESAPRFLECVRAQTLLPDEILMIDAGSTDRTVEVIERCKGELPVVVHRIGPAFPGKGRNYAISRARNEIVAIMDAGIQFDRDWLASLALPFAADPALEAVFGGYRPLCENNFLRATSLFVACDKDPRYGFCFPVMPSMAIRKSLYLMLGGCPEELRAGEDSVFFRRLFEYGPKFAVAQKAVVHWQMDDSWRYLIRKCFHAAKFEILSGYLRKRSLVLMALYPGMAFLALGAFLWSPVLALGALALFSYRVTGSKRMDPETYGTLTSSLAGILWLALVTFVADLSHLAGNLTGLYLYLGLKDRPKLSYWRGARFERR